MKPSEYKAMADAIEGEKGSARGKKLTIGLMFLVGSIPALIGIYVLGSIFVAVFL